MLLFSDKMGIFDVGLMDEIGFFHRRNLGPPNPPLLTCKTLYRCTNFMVIELLKVMKNQLLIN